MSLANIIPASRLFVVSSVGTTANHTLFNAESPHMKVICAWGIMSGAGAGSDTVKIDDGTNDLTDTVDVSAKGDTDLFLVGEIDDAYQVLAKGSSLIVTRASAAAVDVYILCMLLGE